MKIVYTFARLDVRVSANELSEHLIEVDTQYGRRGTSPQARVTSLTMTLDPKTGETDFSGNGLLIKADGTVGVAARVGLFVPAEKVPPEVKVAMLNEAHAKLRELLQGVNQR